MKYLCSFESVTRNTLMGVLHIVYHQKLESSNQT